MSVESPALVQAVNWIDQLVVGPLAVSLAVIAVAITGLLMLRGHVPLEAAFRIVIGCFIIFGAPGIALGIMSAARNVTAPEVVSPSPNIAPITKPPATYDPYAGAATPVR
ncbi:TrbC/VirB2 family protein [Sphingomonas sp. PP-F2F-G114-C0414]|uniref:TrbC/VirB2 family protein n=1 Tax=Sphingomonas sp. PP-F2F-G114-C0414 TaxID=2135662 RepID=UPI001604F04C